MANYEFPSNDKATTASTTTTQSNTNSNNAPLTNAEAKKHIDSVKKAIKEKSEKEERAREKRRQERKEKLEKIWQGVQDKLSNVTDKVADIGEDVSSNITEEVFGSGFIATQMNNVFGKTLQKISDSLKWIGSNISTFFSKIWHWLVNVAKKFSKIFSRNGLFGIIFNHFKWLKQKLTNGFTKLWKMLESIKLYNILGGLLGSLFSAIRGTISLGGDFIKDLIKYLAGTAAFKWLTNGMTHLGKLFSSLTLGSIIEAIGGFLARLIPKAFAGPLSGIITAFSPSEIGGKEEDAYYTALATGAIPANTTLEEFKEKYNNPIDTTDQEALDEATYNRLLKEYPIIAKEQFKKRWLIDSDKDKNGLQDYSAERLAKFNTIINNPNNPNMINDLGLSQAAIEELKRKSTLKNTAGVSST